MGEMLGIGKEGTWIWGEDRGQLMEVTGRSGKLGAGVAWEAGG